MKCSNCKLSGYNKNNCPRCKEKTEEKINRMLEILPTKTIFIALAYFSLSQAIQRSEKEFLGVKLPDFLGTGGDLLALKSGDAGIILGGMLSLFYEAAGGQEGFDLSILTNWLEKQGLTKEAWEGLTTEGGMVSPSSFVTVV